MYFRNVNNNVGIFEYLIATAEDQETKESALAYHFIRKAEVAPTATDVADRIEAWLARNFAVFKIADALKTLDRFGLVRREAEWFFVPPLEPAIAQLHQVWNNFSSVSSETSAPSSSRGMPLAEFFTGSQPSAFGSALLDCGSAAIHGEFHTLYET